MYLGIEIGGTKLQLGLGRGDGELLSLWRGSVDAAAGGEGIRRQIVAAIQELLAKAGVAREELRGIGVGFGGPTDDATQSVIKSHHIEGWHGFPLASWLTDLVGLPTVICNDADVAGLAEALFGAGKGLSPVFYMTIGSGIGGGLIIDGEIYRGCGRGAMEIGHTVVISDVGVAEGMGRRILEAVASGWSIAKRAREELQNRIWPESILTTIPPGDITAIHVADAARRNDQVARFVLEEARIGLTQALLQVIVLLCPRRIVIGGGVSLIGEDLLFRPVRQMVAARTFAPFAGLTDIVPAALGEEVVVHGALALARKKLGG